MDEKRQGLLRLPPWTVTAICVLFGLQMLRVLLPTITYHLRDTVGLSSLTLAPLALGIFALGIFAVPLCRALGLGRGLAFVALGLALLRLAEQVVTAPPVDLFLSAAGVMLFTSYVSLAYFDARRPNGEGTTAFGLALLLGIALDTALHAASRTLDLSWQPGLFPLAVEAPLAAALILALRQDRAGRSSRGAAAGVPGPVWPVIALGPWLFLQLLIFQNVAQVAAVTGLSSPAAGTLVVAYDVVGILAALGAAGMKTRAFPASLLLGLLLVACVLVLPVSSTLAVLALAVGGIVSALVLVSLLGARKPDAAAVGFGRTALATTLAFELFVISAFLYYVSLDLTLGFRPSAVPPVVAALVAVMLFFSTAGRAPAGVTRPFRSPAWPAMLLVLLPIVPWLGRQSPQPVAPAATNDRLRVMSYNLHQGFDTSGSLQIEALASVIEASGADVVALQEVSRGYVINGSLDMLAWLEERLRMPYVWGPTANPQWGNAILSRYPIAVFESVPLPPDTLNLRRGYIDARIDIGGKQVRVLATHLHHPPGDSDERQMQVARLIEAWDQTPHTVLLGDLNAEPETPEMNMLAGAGLTDVALRFSPEPSYTWHSDRLERRIDYIWVTPDFEPSDFEIPASTASDHLGLVVTLRAR